MSGRTQTRRGRAWRILEHHYGARNAFKRVFKDYEQQVKRLVDELGVGRADLTLGPAETRELFDTAQLHTLIEEHLVPLRSAAHAFFRDSDVSEPYDSKVSRIYHELSILKEEHLSVRNFPRDGGHREFSRLFREVSEYYPQRLRRVKDLLTRATRRLEEKLPEFQDDPIVLRSAFLFREDLWPDSPRPGLVRFLTKMFPEDGAAHGFLQVARSFLTAGFFDYAIESARMGVAAAGKEAQARSTRGQQVRETISELDSLVARAKTERAALEEASK